MQSLADPLKDRKVKQLPAPPALPLKSELFFLPGNDQLPNWQVIMHHLSRQGKFKKKHLLWLVAKTRQVLQLQNTCLQVQDPVTVVGDIHGQYYDLLKIIQLGGDLNTQKLLFLGDYVDRGAFSLECVILLFAIKVNFPKNVFLLRGNHESRRLATHFTFRQEVLYKQDQEVFDAIMDCFDALPLACVVNNNFFTVHGGISPHLSNPLLLNKLDLRGREPDLEGLVCDLLWSDPSKGPEPSGFTLNKARGCSFQFGEESAKNFLQKNRLVSIIRGHEVQQEGFKFQWPKATGLPQTVTLFSAPNYCDSYRNAGAVIKFKNNCYKIKQFSYSPHPVLLPNFMNLFDLSLPFIAERTTLILMNLIAPKQKTDKQFQARHNTLRKIHARQNAIKEESQALTGLQGLCPDDKVLISLLSKKALGKDTKSLFEAIMAHDSKNERVPS